GSAAVRVLTGARWQLGIADLRALWQRARELSLLPDHDATRIADGAALRQALDSGLPGDAAERAGLADAIADPGAPQYYSVPGYARIIALGNELAMLRERLGQPLTDLVADVEQLTGIAVEAAARRVGTDPGAGREHLDAFADVVAGYAADHTATLTGLLAFLGAAEEVEDGLEPGEVEVSPDRVQVLTVHSAKGLEWEVVAVPHVARDVFPSGRASASWLGAVAELPPQLRGDRAAGPDDADGVPVLELDGLGTRADLDAALKDHKKALARRRLDEDRRLFYVALTRTERALFISAHHWAATGSAPKGPSPFLLELKQLVDDCDGERAPAVVARWDPAPDEDAANPLLENPVSAAWPADPLGPRRAGVAGGAQAVLDALESAEDPDAEPDDPDGWAADVDALLAEHAEADRPHTEVVLPAQLSASQLVELRADPDRLAARLRRPLPYPPNPMARRGTAFHAWVERRYAATSLLDLDELPGAADIGAPAESDLAALQMAFERSAWAARTPIDVEVPFETLIGGAVVRGRIDAVFADPDGGYTVVDWKTGAEPTEAEQDSVVIQLAVYRVAWARLMAARTGVPAADVMLRVRAAFHYVRPDHTIAPTPLPDLQALEALVRNDP
ncbi:MAG: ATP-dependent helicase, partial [Mycobacteriaceae bacterium]|nr:ATP-dependent helicase [Mycobacteriaceae bacterium]